MAILNKKEGSQLSGDRAEYKTVSGVEIIQITGNPSWTQKDRVGKADVIQMERKSKTFKALGHAVTRLPGTDLKKQLTLIPNMDAQTNASVKVTESIEIQSDAFELREHDAAFDGHVLIAEKPESESSSKASCERLLLGNLTQKGDYGSLTMEGNVVLAQGKSQAFGRETRLYCHEFCGRVDR